MTLRVAMIADDLTGALDASAPFALCGLKTMVARHPEAIEAALAQRPDVLCVSTGTRESPPETAAAVVGNVARRLRDLEARITFKKVDSRLKGPLAAELRAMLAGSGLDRAVIAPAIPDLGRLVEAGSVVGQGVAEPIAVAERAGGAYEVPDTPDQAAMLAVAQSLLDRPVLAVGARGLAQALAQVLGRWPPIGHGLVLPYPMLVAIGSRDPITRRQLEALPRGLPVAWAPNGAVSARLSSGPVQVLATSDAPESEPIQVVAERFAQGVARLVGMRPPRSLVMSGGETADAILAALRVDALRVGGEVLPGVPWCEGAVAGHAVTLVTKSGGFGGAETISRLAGLAPAPIL